MKTSYLFVASLLHFVRCTLCFTLLHRGFYKNKFVWLNDLGKKTTRFGFLLFGVLTEHLTCSLCCSFPPWFRPRRPPRCPQRRRSAPSARQSSREGREQRCTSAASGADRNKTINRSRTTPLQQKKNDQPLNCWCHQSITLISWESWSI